ARRRNFRSGRRRTFHRVLHRVRRPFPSRPRRARALSGPGRESGAAGQQRPRARPRPRARRHGGVAARDGIAPLLVRYPPLEDALLTRGDGCFPCRAHGETCDGLEAEWWTDLEWEGFYNTDASD